MAKQRSQSMYLTHVWCSICRESSDGAATLDAERFWQVERYACGHTWRGEAMVSALAIIGSGFAHP